MTDNNPASVTEHVYNGANLIHYVCSYGNSDILKVISVNKLASYK